jgi:hypothetical protein
LQSIEQVLDTAFIIDVRSTEYLDQSLLQAGVVAQELNGSLAIISVRELDLRL